MLVKETENLSHSALVLQISVHFKEHNVELRLTYFVMVEQILTMNAKPFKPTQTPVESSC